MFCEWIHGLNPLEKSKTDFLYVHLTTLHAGIYLHAQETFGKMSFLIRWALHVQYTYKNSVFTFRFYMDFIFGNVFAFDIWPARKYDKF